MHHRVPHDRRYWRLVSELKEDGIVSESETEEDGSVTGSESEEEGSEETHWGSEESEEETDTADSDGSFNDEEDWFLENLHLGSLPQ